MPAKLTKASAKTATVNLANIIDSLVAGSDIVFIDNHEQLIPRHVQRGGDVRHHPYHQRLAVARSHPAGRGDGEAAWSLAGWKLEDHSSAKGKYLAAMSSSVDPSQAWFLLLGGDSTVAKQPVVTVQLASPDISGEVGSFGPVARSSVRRRRARLPVQGRGERCESADGRGEIRRIQLRENARVGCREQGIAALDQTLAGGR